MLYVADHRLYTRNLHLYSTSGMLHCWKNVVSLCYRDLIRPQSENTRYTRAFSLWWRTDPGRLCLWCEQALRAELPK